MTMTPGERVGPYEIVRRLGAGGMGEVYVARDGKLGRDVALKTLPPMFASDQERLARFGREARTLASLNHPNIAQIYGLEGEGGRVALVMELVAGEDLAARIARGPVPVADALPIARQLADALEAAHDAGIVHRDLKPANVMVREDGTVKVLDFGLAKAATPEGPASEPSNSPTLTARATGMGMILGTAAYMSPEQARGRTVDRRADIWAFGVILYELLTGRRTFEGEEISDVLAAVLRQEIDWTKLPADTPPAVRRLLTRCLDKDPRRRLSAIGDARFELDEPAAPPATVAPPSSRASLRPMLFGAAAGMLVAAGAGVAFWSLAPRPSPPALSRLTIAPPAGLALYSDPVEHAISPDGRAIAYVTGDKISQAKNQIWIRTLDTLAPRRLADSDGGYLPFWSPDSRRVGFFSADAKLKTAPIDGDRADVICSVTNSRGGSWSPANVIVFAPDGSGPLFKVSANGGEPAPVTSLDASRQETGHRFPVFLPDGEHFLFAALPGKAGKFDIFAGSIAGGARELIGTMETSPEYAPAMPGLASGTGAAGWLIFMRQGALAAQAFDPARRKLVGEAITLPDVPGGLEDTATIWTTGQAASASRAGVLSYFTEPLVDTRLVYVDVAGALAPAPDLPNARYSGVSVSPDGSRAIVVRQTTRTESSLWQVDLLRGGVTPLAVGRGQQSGVVWSPDGRRIVYMSDRDGTENLFTWDIAAGGPESPFHQSPVPFKQPDDWSRDGKWVIFRQLDPGMFQNVWAMPAAAGAKPIPVVQRPGRDLGGRLSPDGRWIAYLSDDSGRSEVYLQPFPDSGGARVPVTTSGAGAVWWGADSRRLFVLDATFVRLLSIDIDFTSGPRPGPEKSVGVLPRGLRFLDLMPDRKRVLALAPAKVVEASITVVQNWELGLESRR